MDWKFCKGHSPPQLPRSEPVPTHSQLHSRALGPPIGHSRALGLPRGSIPQLKELHTHNWALPCSSSFHTGHSGRLSLNNSRTRRGECVSRPDTPKGDLAPHSPPNKCKTVVIEQIVRVDNMEQTRNHGIHNMRTDRAIHPSEKYCHTHTKDVRPAVTQEE